MGADVAVVSARRGARNAAPPDVCYRGKSGHASRMAGWQLMTDAVDKVGD
jgi:hypothetical protein